METPPSLLAIREGEELDGNPNGWGANPIQNGNGGQKKFGQVKSIVAQFGEFCGDNQPSAAVGGTFGD
jgi:hypothetical protein